MTRLVADLVLGRLEVAFVREEHGLLFGGDEHPFAGVSGEIEKTGVIDLFGHQSRQIDYDKRLTFNVCEQCPSSLVENGHGGAPSVASRCLQRRSSYRRRKRVPGQTIQMILCPNGLNRMTTKGTDGRSSVHRF